MTVKSIITALSRRGYKVTRTLSTGIVCVSNKRGFFGTYLSYHEAYRYIIQS